VNQEGKMLRPEPLDIVIILLVAMLLFGASRLPESARAIGKAIREFRDAVTGKENESPKDETNDARSDYQRDSA
jgi:sec-independent protein translocase protein TatA